MLTFCVSRGPLPVTPVISTWLTNSRFLVLSHHSALSSESFFTIFAPSDILQASSGHWINVTVPSGSCMCGSGMCRFVCVPHYFSLILMSWHSSRQLNRVKQRLVKHTQAGTHAHTHTLTARHRGGWHTAMWSFRGSLGVCECVCA